ncbi:hypothetical protein KFU94_40570 [Chloroflexi bacterium TSY]|nr:hypothetical protein [Chloroflexi bacterium TSY]
MQTILTTTRNILFKGLRPWAIIGQIPFTPHIAFSKVGKGGYFWLGSLLYLVGVLLGLYIIIQNGGTQIEPEPTRDHIFAQLFAFHPIQGLVLLFVIEGLRADALLWYHYLLIFSASLLAMPILVILIRMTTKSILNITISISSLFTAVFLMSGFFSILSWAILSIPSVGDFVADNLSPLDVLFLWISWPGFIIYFTVALVNLSSLSTWQAFLIIILTLLSGKGLSDKGQTERGGKKNPP